MEPKSLKILYGITKSNFGGAQRYVFDLATEMKKKGVEVEVLCGGEGLLVEKLEAENIRVYSLPTLGRDISFLNDLKSFIFIYKILRQVRPDVFHINSSKMGLGALAGRMAGTKKIIFTLHGFPWNEDRSNLEKIMIKSLVWVTILLSHKTICVSDKAQENVSTWPFVKNKLVVIKNGIAPFSLVDRTDPIFTVGAVAELHYIKGLDILLKAWAKFIKNHSAKLVIYGEGEERDSLEKLSLNLGIYDSIHFMGFVPDARSHLREFDVFVLPSRSEAMPYAPLEAGLASLPVIATSVGGIPEVIEDKQNGLLIPKEDPKALLLALETLYNDENMRVKLRQNLEKTVSQEFTLEKMARATMNLYE